MLTTLPALCRVHVSLISLAYFLCEKNGVEEIVRPRPPRDDPVTLRYSFNLNHPHNTVSMGVIFPCCVCKLTDTQNLLLRTASILCVICLILQYTIMVAPQSRTQSWEWKYVLMVNTATERTRFSHILCTTGDWFQNGPCCQAIPPTRLDQTAH